MGWDPAVVPDPQDPATYERSKLDWSELEGGRHARLLEVYRELARLRRALPDLTDPSFGAVSCTVDEEARVFTMRRGSLLVAVNFGDAEAMLARRPRPRRPLHHPRRRAPLPHTHWRHPHPPAPRRGAPRLTG